MIQWIHEGQNTTDRSKKSSVTAMAAAEIPIPIALIYGMPSLQAETRDLTERFEDHSTRWSVQDFRLGFLHHAAEGAPLWKVSAGRWGALDREGHWISRFDLNLEKIFPSLRPNNSDTLDAWLGVTHLAENDHKHFMFPDVGWSWRAYGYAVIDIIIPKRIRLAYRDRSWMAGIVAKQEQIIFQIEDSQERRAQQLTTERRNYLIIEASRALDFGLNATLEAGIRVPRTPVYGASMTWSL